MPSTRKTEWPGGLVALTLTMALAACGRPIPPPESSGELHVGVRNSPATYYIARNGEAAGFEHDLIQAYGQSQHWTLTWAAKPRPEALFQLLTNRQIHLAAATLPQAVIRDRHLIAGPVLFETPVHIVYRTSERAPRNITGFAGQRRPIRACHRDVLITGVHLPRFAGFTVGQPARQS